MQDRCSYIKDPGDFLKEIRNIGKTLEGALLVTVNFVGFYQSCISHGTNLEALRKGLKERVYLRHLLKI